MNILVINAGSSSLKYQLIRMEDETILCKGVCERIGIDGKYSYKTAGGYAVEKDTELFTHKDAFDVILHEMVSGEGHVIDSVEEIAAVGHRVTHGGDKFSRSVLIDEEAINTIVALRDISPLHNPPPGGYHPGVPQRFRRKAAYGRGIRYGVPRHHAAQGLYLCHPL